MSEPVGYVKIDASVCATGLWCDVCMLPSRVELTLSILDVDGVHSFDGGSVCIRNDGDWFTHDAECDEASS